MITLAMSAVVAASPSRVWSALTEPRQAPQWRPGATRLLSAPPVLSPGSCVRIRGTLRDLPVTLEARTLEVTPGARLRSEVRLGLFRFEEAFTLSGRMPSGETRVGLRLTTSSEAPVLGGTLDRFDVRRFATALAGETLEALRAWCERSVAANDASSL